MSLPLIPEAALKVHDGEVRLRLRTLDQSYLVDVEDELYGTSFRVFLLFTHWPTLLEGEGGLTKEAVFYNRYYWFLKFVRLYALKHGYDAGMEQQVFQLLKHSDFCLDWSFIQQIEDRVKQEVEQT